LADLEEVRERRKLTASLLVAFGGGRTERGVECRVWRRLGEEKLPQEKWREERRRAVFKATS
jgi:hypothetical protein